MKKQILNIKCYDGSLTGWAGGDRVGQIKLVMYSISHLKVQCTCKRRVQQALEKQNSVQYSIYQFEFVSGFIWKISYMCTSSQEGDYIGKSEERGGECQRSEVCNRPHVYRQ